MGVQDYSAGGDTGEHCLDGCEWQRPRPEWLQEGAVDYRDARHPVAARRHSSDRERRRSVKVDEFRSFVRHNRIEMVVGTPNMAQRAAAKRSQFVAAVEPCHLTKVARDCNRLKALGLERESKGCHEVLQVVPTLATKRSRKR